MRCSTGFSFRDATVNDIMNVSKKLVTVLFAVDANTFITGRHIDSTIIELNNQLKTYWSGSR